MIGFRSNSEPITGDAARDMLQEIERVQSCPRESLTRVTLPTNFRLVEA